VVLHSFTGGADGGYPYAGVIRDSAGNLYRTILGGGSGFSHGVVYKLDTAGRETGRETVLYTFTGGADGAYPGGGLIRDSAAISTGQLSSAARRTKASCISWIPPAMRRCFTASRAELMEARPSRP
jgi:hypothetical protein